MENIINSKDVKIAAGQFIQEKKYWQNKLSGEFQRSYFPYDYNENTPGECPRNAVTFKFSGELQARLEKITGGSYPNVHMVLTAGAAALSAQYTGHRDIVVGSPTDRQDVEGALINTILPLRIFLPADKTFKELLMDVRRVTNGAIENQNYPIETLFPADAGAHSPLFDVVVLLENIQEKKYVSHLQPGIIFSFQAAEEHLTGELDYDTSKYEKESIERIVRHFMRLLHVALFNVNVKIGDIELLSEEDKSELTRFNSTRTAYPHREPIHRLFESQAEKTPDNIALIEGNESTVISYKQLSRRTDRLAKFLLNRGAVPNTVVGILMERSVEQVSVILAILKSGCAYLPLDIDYPPERKSYILNDSGAALLITQRHLEKNLKWKGKILYVEDMETQEDGVGITDPVNPRVQPSDLAYVIYTSGSTGKPKGVAVPHRALVNYAWWAAKTYVKNEKINFPYYTSTGFDLTVTSIFTPLLTGNTVFIYREENKEFLVEKIFDENKVEAVKLTPVHLMLLADHFGKRNGSKIKRFIVGGERFETRLAQRIHDNFDGDIEIYNEYGPTEAAVGCMIYKFNPQKDKGASVPIGGPADNLRIYLLDKNKKDVPVGGLGELYIAGNGLAKGYLNKPELTAEKFIPNPFVPGEKMYKTGDEARRLTDGNLEFLGRTDQQVKIKGYRIETGEVENCLLKHEGIEQVVVAAKRDASGYDYLAAYVVPSEEMDQTGFDAGELKDYLSGTLPEFMIPSYFVPMESLPTTINGKIDRGALPEPSLDSMDSGVEYKPPKNEVEEILVKVWKEVFRVERVSVLDNYFSLGGDSIKGIQLSARMLEFNLKVSISDIFSHPTIEELAGVVSKTERTIDQGPVEGEVPLTPIQQWFFDKFQDLENPRLTRHFNQSVLLYREEGFDADIVREVFSKIVEHHDALRIVYPMEGSRVTQVNRGLEEKGFDFEIIEIEDIKTVETEVEKTCSRLQGEIDLSEGPLIKLGLFKTPGRGDHLLVAVHHLVMDAVSGRILMEDFNSGYRQVLNGEELKFPRKTDSFRDWANRLKDYASGPTALKELEYWKKIEKLGLEPLPTDKIIPGDNGSRTYKNREHISITLSKSETSQLLKEVNRVYNTEINDVLLTGLCLALRDWSKIDKIRINLEGHGRENILDDIDISRTLGWFTAQYPVLFDMAVPGTAEGIRTVKDTLRRIPNKGIGYGILKYLTPDEKKENVQFAGEPEIGFNYLGQFDQTEPRGNGRNLFEFSPLNKGFDVNPDLGSSYKLEIIGAVNQGVLWLGIHYDKYEYRASSIKALAETFRENLITIIRHCVNKEETEKTLSDFTSPDLETGDMEAIINELEEDFDE